MKKNVSVLHKLSVVAAMITLSSAFKGKMMKFLKQIYVAVLFLNLPLCAMQCQINQKNEPVSLEWVDITSKNISTNEMVAFFKQLETVYISAFKEQEKTIMQKEHLEKYLEMVKQGITVEKALEDGWKGILDTLKMCLNKGVEMIPCAFIKNTKNEILGFCIFIPLAQKMLFPIMQQMGVMKELKWLKEPKNETNLNNEAFVRILAVSSNCKRCGYGKKLIFSIFSYLPQIKKIYLETDASKSNENTQGFYEHCGFECTATYLNRYDDKLRVYEFNSK